jgi:hypothetical protein
MTSSITSLKDDERDVIVPEYLLADNQISSDVNIGQLLNRSWMLIL